MSQLYWPAPTQWLSIGVTLLLIITAVLPVLPPDTPGWVTHALLIMATVLTALTTKLGDKPQGRAVPHEAPKLAIGEVKVSDDEETKP